MYYLLSPFSYNSINQFYRTFDFIIMIFDLEPLCLDYATAITPYRREPESTLVISNGKIAQMGRRDDVQVPANAIRIDLDGRYVLPGFIDVHVHGGKGYDFTDEEMKAYEEIGRFHASHGTTSLLATIYPQPFDQFLENIKRLRQYCESTGPDRIVEGIHLEGPFINREMPGAIRPEYMWPAHLETFQKIMEAGGPWNRYMTIAPELPGAMEILRTASIGNWGRHLDINQRPQPIHLSIGHSKAHYEQISDAIDNGLDGVTHIFNAMAPVHHRHPGVLVGTLLRDELFVEVIADAVHVHPAVLQLLMKTKHHDKILLVTDAMRAAGQPDGIYEFIDRKVIVSDSRAYLADSIGTLAGSTLTMENAVKTMVEDVGASLEQASHMASLNAARILEWKYRRGILAVGKDADLVVLNPDLTVYMTIKAGYIVYNS
jgi:N-acetylglucosamine-6-phosphate deacetylase